jgi:hypothetical protein
VGAGDVDEVPQQTCSDSPLLVVIDHDDRHLGSGRVVVPARVPGDPYAALARLADDQRGESESVLVVEIEELVELAFGELVRSRPKPRPA